MTNLNVENPLTLNVCQAFTFMNLVYPERIPKYWDRINQHDQQQYAKIQREFSSTNVQNRKYKSTTVFSNFIDTIHSFVMRGDADDKARALVCGIYWTGNTVVLNSRQIMTMMSKCKSSINSSLLSLGYEIVPVSSNTTATIIKLFPELGRNFGELRQWTIREQVKSSSEGSIEQKSRQKARATFVNQGNNDFLFREPNLVSHWPIGNTDSKNTIEESQDDNKNIEFMGVDNDLFSDLFFDNEFSDFSSVFF